MSLKIDPDIFTLAKHWGQDPALIQAVNNAEGDILKAVQCSQPTVQTRYQALEVVCRSATHRMSDFLREKVISYDGLNTNLHKLDEAFVYYWATFWAPVGALNDPDNLNAAWPKNVLAIWRTK